MPLKDQISFPPSLAISSQASSPHELGLSAVFEHDRGTDSYIGRSMTFSSGAQAVRSTSVKKNPVRDRTVARLRGEVATANKALAKAHPPLAAYFRGTPGRALSGDRPVFPTDQDLQRAAAVHRVAHAVGDFSTLAVARSFRLTHRQAQRWVRIARAKGYIA